MRDVKAPVLERRGNVPLGHGSVELSLGVRASLAAMLATDEGKLTLAQECGVDYKASNSAPRTRSGRSMSLDDLFGAAEQEWQEQALCAQTDPEAFFPEKGGSTREAKRICQACAVRDECLEYALLNDERFGIWGGLSERERRRLKRDIG